MTDVLAQSREPAQPPPPRRTRPGGAKSSGLFRAVWRWHFFAGLLVLPFLLWLAVTGALYLYKPEIERQVYADWIHIEPGRPTLPLDTLAARQGDMVETGKLYRLQYLDMGTRTLVDLLNAEQELQQARFDSVNTMHDLRRLQLDCLYYSGRSRDAFALTGTRFRGVTL